MADKRADQLKEITERLEQGVKDIFTSEMYTKYLLTMSKFHNYSFNNTLLIAMQRPDATLVAGYNAWKNKFNRYVKKGEKGIQIIAPAPVKEQEEREKIDKDTGLTVLNESGEPEIEVVERVIPRFRVTTVFDYNPLPKNNNISTTYEEGYVLFAGRLEREHKGLDYLIDVIKKISEEVPKLRVTIIGDGPSHSWLKAEIEKTGLKEKVNLLGTTDNVYQFYSKASVMVQTSRWEGFGMTILEAMSCGIPVVAFHNYGPDEIIRDSVDGYLVDHFDTEAFAKKVAEILKQPERRKQMGKCAIERSRDFSLEKVLPLFKRYLEEAAKEL